MNEEKILNTVRSLARLQGFYGRLYEGIMDLKKNNPDGYQEFINCYSSCKDEVDFVMALER